MALPEDRTEIEKSKKNHCIGESSPAKNIQCTDEQEREAATDRESAGLGYLESEEHNDDGSLVVTVQLTEQMLLAAKQVGASPREWAQSTLAANCATTASIAYRKARGKSQTQAISARLPKEIERILKERADAVKASVSLVASSLVETFLNAADPGAAELPHFDAPPAGRSRPKDKTRMDSLRKQLSRIQLRLSEQDVEKLGDMAYSARRTRGDYIGSVLMYELTK